MNQCCFLVDSHATLILGVAVFGVGKNHPFRHWNIGSNDASGDESIFIVSLLVS